VSGAGPAAAREHLEAEIWAVLRHIFAVGPPLPAPVRRRRDTDTVGAILSAALDYARREAARAVDLERKRIAGENSAAGKSARRAIIGARGPL
jgi:hypothetical protein